LLLMVSVAFAIGSPSNPTHSQPSRPLPIACASGHSAASDMPICWAGRRRFGSDIAWITLGKPGGPE
jgi:hypothetical protein